MQKTSTSLPNVFIINPTVKSNNLGAFVETYHIESFSNQSIFTRFVQDSHRQLNPNVLEGLQLQVSPKAQARLLRVIQGTAFIVAADVNPNSSTYRQWTAVQLTENQPQMFYIGDQYAHGIYALNGTAGIIDKRSNTDTPEHKHIIRWNDPELNITWPLNEQDPILSKDDLNAPLLKDTNIEF